MSRTFFSPRLEGEGISLLSSRLMGHTTATMTLRYSHPPASEAERIRAQIDSRLCTNGVHAVVPIDAKDRKQSVNRCNPN